MRHRWLGLAVVFLLQNYAQSTPVAAQTAGAPAPDQQQQQTSNAPTPVVKVTTRLVTVDVVVTDQRGQPVTGLKDQDFALLEDGKPQRILNFQPHQPLSFEAASTEPKRGKLPPNVFSNAPAFNPNNSLNVILLDLLNSDFDSQSYGRQQILKYLASIPDKAPITVALYSLGGKLQLVQDFTSDFAALRDTMSGIKSEHIGLLETLAPDPSDDSPGSLALKELAKAVVAEERSDRRLEYTLQALLSLAQRLSGYPGRKNLIWISTTFPIDLRPDGHPRLNDLDRALDYEQMIVSASQALVDAQIAVYPIDPRGLLSPSQYGGAEASPLNSGAEQSTMDQMAKLTGGKAFYNQNDLRDAIRHSIADGSTYYTLSYYPNNKDWNGKFRKIAVKVDRPGVKLRHRAGYYALNLKTVQDSRSMLTALGRALNLDSPISTALLFKTGVVQPSGKTGNKLLLNLALDPQAVSFEKRADGLQHATVYCAVRAYNLKHELIKTEANTLSVALDEQGFIKARQTSLFARVGIDLPAGSYILRLGVMDAQSGTIGTVNAAITVPPH